MQSACNFCQILDFSKPPSPTSNKFHENPSRGDGRTGGDRHDVANSCFSRLHEQA